MQRERRLRDLEASISRAVDDPDEHCLRCLGLGGYRKLNDRAHQRIVTGKVYTLPVVCRSCGGPSFHGALLAERAALGLP